VTVKVKFVEAGIWGPELGGRDVVDLGAVELGEVGAVGPARRFVSSG
jgi:hypothetical protein